MRTTGSNVEDGSSVGSRHGKNSGETARRHERAETLQRAQNIAAGRLVLGKGPRRLRRKLDAQAVQRARAKLSEMP